MPPPVTARVLLVEGASDAAALHGVAALLGRSLPAEGVSVVAMGGATNVARHLLELPDGVAVGGLYDAAEERFFRGGLERAGFGRVADAADLEAHGFFGCDPDLEGELVRALGLEQALRVVAAQGELSSFRVLQRQPAQRDRTVEQHLHRFLGTRSGRKAQYAAALVAALAVDAVPLPLLGVLGVGPPQL
ncbi:TOPRIM nucleotidyl transferase/hydrolase domain-containing protein [Nocardioides lianchengensis]|uniref:TOPRIM nucleotidyl transferase/hydrolase domain-containing protein n=1 Tax=Nocardioides lianchengensis TaxID=1045774 RepID=UPI000B834E1C|nr:TOPRIM nucleotidyl transferase/hydrolase domain-containing protein [Nocardioides lianchengensis]NYG11907.1 hypothetical protein [Nocardioides lianchengensis]